LSTYKRLNYLFFRLLSLFILLFCREKFVY